MENDYKPKRREVLCEMLASFGGNVKNGFSRKNIGYLGNTIRYFNSSVRYFCHSLKCFGEGWECATVNPLKED